MTRRKIMYVSLCIFRATFSNFCWLYTDCVGTVYSAMLLCTRSIWYGHSVHLSAFLCNSHTRLIDLTLKTYTFSPPATSRPIIGFSYSLPNVMSKFGPAYAPSRGRSTGVKYGKELWKIAIPPPCPFCGMSSAYCLNLVLSFGEGWAKCLSWISFAHHSAFQHTNI